MGLPDLYPAQVGSPYTTLAVPYTTGGATMTVVDATKLPDAPNIVCLAGSVSGEFRYSGKDGNILIGVVKLPGTPNATWSAGTYAFRGIAAYDHASIVEHLTYQRSHIVEATLDLTTNLTYSGRVLDGAEAGENLAFGDLAVLAESGKFMKANPATLATLDGTIALVVSGTIAAGSQGMFLLRGLIRKDSWTFSPGKELYAGNGTLTHEPPATGTQIIRKVGTALAATIIEFNPSSTLHAEYLVSVLPVNTVTKDNNDIERKFWKDTCDQNNSGQYTMITGTFPVVDTDHYVFDATKEFRTNVAPPQIEGIYRIIVQFVGDNEARAVFIKPGENSYLVARKTATNDYELSLYLMGIRMWTQKQSSGQITWDTVNPNIVELIVTATTIDVYLNGVLEGGAVRATYPIETTAKFQIYGNGTVAAPTELYEVAYLPPESYADPFTTDTTERYQPVLGTVAYDDANKRMNVTTATGANGKASGRLKSYKFCEGAQIYDVLLPTGADGDFICLATHSANGLMTDGIGVGLQSDGAGNWNLATLSRTTVTEGADSGLDDADVARIEIEKDITGAYWYYIYDAAGAKPATATGKLFTTLTEGYTGWYANGAGATTQTYAIDNISIRAESIVGRTNVEVTEPFWFRDEFGEDSIGRYSAPGYMTVSEGVVAFSSNGRYGILPSAKMTDEFTVSVDVNLVSDSRSWILFGNALPKSGGSANSDGVTKYLIWVESASNKLILNGYGSYSGTIQWTDVGLSTTEPNTISLNVSGTTLTVTVNGTPLTPYTLPVAPSGYVGLGRYTGDVSFDNLQISGTRVYQKPIHRGAMLESYHDGTQEVVGTTFVDDCQWDRSAEWVNVLTPTWDTVNGKITLNQNMEGIFTKGRFGDGYISYRVKFGADLSASRISLKFCSVEQNFDEIGVTTYYLHTTSEGDMNLYKIISGVLTQLGSTIATMAINTEYKIEVLKAGSTIKVYIDGVLKATVTDTSLISGYIGFGCYAGNLEYRDIQIIAASPDATNGIAACIPPIGGGARYGVEESVYIPITPGTEIPVGSAVISPNAKSTVVGTALTTFAQTPAGVSASLEYATGTKACPGLSDALAPAGRHRVKADRNTLTNIGVKGSVAGTSPAVYIDSLHVRKQEAA